MSISNFEIGTQVGDIPNIRFGQGRKNLIIFPGLEDSLQPVTIKPYRYLWHFRKYAKIFTVHILSRKRNLPEKYTTRDMAEDYAKMIPQIGFPVHLMGLGMGSLIAQHFAADFPHYVNGLVLSMAGSGISLYTFQKMQNWIQYAAEEQWSKIYRDMIDTYYRGLHHTLRRLKAQFLTPKPHTPSDFIVSLQACLSHNARSRLRIIRAPTLVLGGTHDQLIPQALFHQLTQPISNASLQLIEGGHKLHIEQKHQFDLAVIRYLQSVESSQNQNSPPNHIKEEFDYHFG